VARFLAKTGAGGEKNGHSPRTPAAERALCSIQVRFVNGSVHLIDHGPGVACGNEEKVVDILRVVVMIRMLIDFNHKLLNRP
jgi:hypothetical protein